MASPYQNPDEDALTRILATLLSGGKSPEQLQEGVKHPQDPSRAGFGLQGAGIGPQEKSSSEQTLAPGEWESLGPEGQRAHTLKQLFNMIQSAGLENMQGIGPHGVEAPSPKGSRSRKNAGWNRVTGPMIPRSPALDAAKGKTLVEGIGSRMQEISPEIQRVIGTEAPTFVAGSSGKARNHGRYVEMDPNYALRLKPEASAGGYHQRSADPVQNLDQIVSHEMAHTQNSRGQASLHDFATPEVGSTPADIETFLNQRIAGQKPESLTLKVKGRQGRLPSGLANDAHELPVDINNLSTKELSNIMRLLSHPEEIETEDSSVMQQSSKGNWIQPHTSKNQNIRASSGSADEFGFQTKQNAIRYNPQFQTQMDKVRADARGLLQPQLSPLDQAFQDLLLKKP